MKRCLLTTAASTLLCSALAGQAPVPGSSRPDAWAKAGQTLTLNVPEVSGRTVNVAGTPATISGPQVRLTIPENASPGRLVVRFANTAGGREVTTREIEILTDVRAADRQAQVLLNPRLTRAQVDALLAKISTDLGGLVSRVSAETLPPAQGTAGSASPCGGTVAQLELRPGVALESVLTKLLELGGNDVWYPDPITSWDSPALSQTQPIQNQSSQSFHYAPFPISPRKALGIDQTPTKLKGKGVTIAVLDTGFSPGLDPLGELTGRVRAPLNATIPYDPVLSLAGAGDFWEGHGTQVAILAAGSKNGVATQASVLPIKVCAPGADGRASCNTRDVLRGLCVALNQVPARELVINLSLGGSAPTSAIHAVLNWAMGQGAVVVAAGGNQGQQANPKEYPAAFSAGTPTQVSLPLFAVASVTPVGALNAAGWRYSLFSTRGNYLNVTAPGEALDIGQAYLYSGTSFAAPLVAGAAALAKSANLNASVAGLKNVMLTGANVSLYPGIQPMLKLKNY